jgi:hypothetical protein
MPHIFLPGAAFGVRKLACAFREKLGYLAVLKSSNKRAEGPAENRPDRKVGKMSKMKQSAEGAAHHGHPSGFAIRG